MYMKRMNAKIFISKIKFKIIDCKHLTLDAKKRELTDFLIAEKSNKKKSLPSKMEFWVFGG